MSDNKISFKSFYFSIGTTSFRMQNFNQKIETQLFLLDEFWKQDKNKNVDWNTNSQIAYYNFIKSNNFLNEGNAPDKAKDARQKTSGVRDIGLIFDNRRLTEVGEKLLEISKANDFESDNFLQIPKDSFIYFQQMLKTFVKVNDAGVRPYILLSRLLKKFDYLTETEFKYFFPFCINETATEFIENKIYEFRSSKINVDNVISEIFMMQKNYQDALKYFLETKNLSEETFCKIGLNRKSALYNKPYFKLYNSLKKVYFENENSNENILELSEILNEKKSSIKNVSTLWKKLLFSTSSSPALKKEPQKYLQTNLFTNCESEDNFKIAFFKTMHLIKTKTTLEDYCDLNRRYLKTTDTLLFSDGCVKFDIIPKYYFSLVDEKFYNEAFIEPTNLEKLTTLEEISPFLKYDERKIFALINKENKTNFSSAAEIKRFVKDERTKRFNCLLDKKFSDETIAKIFELFKNRSSIKDDKAIQELVTDDADCPTIFEYIVAIAWYKICDREGDILSFMKLSLEADLLPKTHAGGGEADIVWKYEKTQNYPCHDLLIEVTIAQSTTQRFMESEPVTRHLGNHLIENKNHHSYCVFITPKLQINLLADFRSRKFMTYYDTKDENNFVEGLMIIPLETDILVFLLKSQKKYATFYKIFHDAFKSEAKPKIWYDELKKEICEN